MGLPKQKVSMSVKKTENWKTETIDYFDRVSITSVSNNRNSNYNKKINFDLINGKFNKADLEYVCNPLGLQGNEFPASLQHYDIISPAYNLLIGEESKRSDNCIVVSDSINDINRKQDSLKQQINNLLQQTLMAGIDPSTIDPNKPLPTPEQILKYHKHNISDLIESKANKILKFVKKDLNTKEVFKRGWKDALAVGEEIYWAGVSNNQLMFRRCNPLNTVIMLDGDTDYVDDALAVIETRLLAPSTILDEFGKDLKPSDVTKLESMAQRNNEGLSSNANDPAFAIDRTGAVVDTGFQGFGSTTVNNGNGELIRVVRVEWKSFKKMFHLEYTDENGIPQEKIVDETFDSKIFKELYPDATTEEFWINEAWEGIKIGDDIYICVQAKENQRRRMDNPYHCKLGYIGLIYNANNTTSVSLVDRLKPYQYLYNIISYRLELAFARDQGKIFLMDLAQLPRSEGIDVDRWMYYLKAMGIAFVNGFEEGRKGSATGKFSTFNQFQAIDLSLANQIQQYIQTLDFIKQQIAFISGVTPQRLGAIDTRELVGNVERSVQQSALITEFLFDSHNEVKRRCYSALVEAAKIAFKDGKKVQYVLDDMGIELLELEEFELEDSEFNVHMTNSNKDQEVLSTIKSMAVEAVKADKATFSTIIDTIINDNPRDIMRNIQKGEEDKFARDKAAQDQQAQIEQSKIEANQQAIEMQLIDKQKDRDLNQYIADTNNETKIQVAEISALRGMEGPTDMDSDGIPDPIEAASLALEERNIASKAFLEKTKLDQDKSKHEKEMSIKEKELNMKKSIEDKKIDAIKVQNASQEKIASEANKLKEKEMANKLAVEKLKIQAAKAKARQSKPKK